MASWRDSASQQAQDDLDGLLNMTLPFAQQMLSKSGEFYPFGATVTTKGETRLLAGDLGHEHPASADVHSLFGRPAPPGPGSLQGSRHLLRRPAPRLRRRPGRA
jgi:hypothetical protein